MPRGTQSSVYSLALQKPKQYNEGERKILKAGENYFYLSYVPKKDKTEEEIVVEQFNISL